MTSMNTENGKTNEPHKIVLNLSQRLDWRNSNKHVALPNSSIYYMWKKITKQYKNKKLKVIAPKCNDDFEFSGGYYSMVIIIIVMMVITLNISYLIL